MNRFRQLAVYGSVIVLLSGCKSATTGGGIDLKLPSLSSQALTDLLAPRVSAAPDSYAPAADEISLDPRSWTQSAKRDSKLKPRFTNGALRIPGADWTNGRVRDGRLDGNGFVSNSAHNFVDRTTEIEFSLDGGGKYMAINIAPNGLPAQFFSTHKSWDGSRILPESDILIMTLKITADGKWTQVVRDKSNGAIVASQGGRASAKQLQMLRSAGFGVNFHDNHAGRDTSVTLYRISGIETPQEIAERKATPPTQLAKELPKSLDEPINMLIAGFDVAGVEKLREAMSSLNRRELLEISLTRTYDSLVQRTRGYKTIVARLALARQAELTKAYDAAAEAEWKAALLKGRMESLFFYGLAAAHSNQPGAVAQAAAKMRQILSQGNAAGIPVAGQSGFPAMLTLAHGLLDGDRSAYDRYVTDQTLSATDRDAVASLLTLRQNEYMAPVLFIDMKKMRFILGKHAKDIGEGVRGYMPKTIAFFDINGQPLKLTAPPPTSVVAPTAGGASPPPATKPSEPAGKVLD